MYHLSYIAEATTYNLLVMQLAEVHFMRCKFSKNKLLVGLVSTEEA